MSRTSIMIIVETKRGRHIMARMSCPKNPLWILPTSRVRTTGTGKFITTEHRSTLSAPPTRWLKHLDPKNRAKHPKLIYPSFATFSMGEKLWKVTRVLHTGVHTNMTH